MKLVIATRNSHKIDEIQSKLRHFPQLECLSLNDFKNIVDVEETGLSFEENACLKAQAYAHATGHMCLADDSGLEIDAMNRQPGVQSARFLGVDTPYTLKNQHILTALSSKANRRARYVAVIALYAPGETCVTFRGTVEGRIANQALGDGGFGYDPIFIPDGEDRSFAQMTLDEKNQRSHRAQALQDCMLYLKEWMLDA